MNCGCGFWWVWSVPTFHFEKLAAMGMRYGNMTWTAPLALNLM